MTRPWPLDDPPPVPPERPGPGDCCGGGCDPCVFDLYEEERARYEAALREWELRNPGAGPARKGDRHE